MYNIIKPNIGDIIQIKSDEWYLYDENGWHLMTTDEQLRFSEEN